MTRRRPYTAWWDSIAALTLTAAEKATLQAMARRVNWDTGGRGYPKVDTLAHDTGLSDRTVQRALHSLTCAAPCGDRRCHHRGLLVIEAPATQWRPTTYRVAITLPQQGMLDETAAHRTRQFMDAARRREDMRRGVA